MKKTLKKDALLLTLNTNQEGRYKAFLTQGEAKDHLTIADFTAHTGEEHQFQFWWPAPLGGLRPPGIAVPAGMTVNLTRNGKPAKKGEIRLIGAYYEKGVRETIL